jgi:hypothetical protein
MSKTEVSGKQVKDGSIELVDLSAAVAGDITTLKSDVATLQTDVAGKASAAALSTVATSGSYNDLSDKPSIPSLSAVEGDISALDGRVTTAEGDISDLQSDVALKANTSSLATVATSGSYNDLLNKPTLFSGSYADLTNKPSIPSTIHDLSDVTITSPTTNQVLQYDGSAWVNGAAPSSFSGSYNDLTNKPTIPSALDDLSDVAITSAAKGHFIVHDGTNFVNARTIEADAAATKPLIVKGAASQSANLFEVQNSSATALFAINSNGTAVTQTAGSGSSAYFRISANFQWVQLGRAYQQFGNYSGGYVGAGDDGVDFTVRMGAALDAEAIRVKGKTAGSTAGPMVGIGETSPGAQLHVTSALAARKGLIVKGAASQSANTFEVQNSAGTINCAIADSGAITTASNFTVRANGASVSKFLLTTGSGIGANLTNRGFVIQHQVSAETQLDFMNTADASETPSESMMCFNLVQNQIGFNTPRTSIGGQVHITSKAAARKGLIVRGAASQSANLFEAQDSTGTQMFGIGPTGSFSSAARSSIGTIAVGPAGGTTSNQNTCLGANAARVATQTGNVSIGYNTHYNLSTGTDNCSVGYNSQSTITGGYNNTALGREAGNGAANGFENVCIGFQAGTQNQYCYMRNIFVGNQAGLPVTVAANLSHAIGIGHQASVAGDHGIAIGTWSAASGADALAIGRSASAAANCLDIRFGNASRITGDSSGNIAIANTLHAKRYTETVANAFNTSLAPSSGTLTVDTSVGNAVLGALSASVTTWAFTNVPTDNSKVTKITAVIAGNASYTYGDACSVNGTAVTDGVMWSGGSAPTATAGTDIITFMIVKDSAGTIKVFGTATTNFS